MTNGGQQSGSVTFNDIQGYSVDFIRRLESIMLGYEKSSPESFSKESEEGRFSSRLTLALEGYQRENGLVVDGKLGSNTFRYLKDRYPDIFNEPLTGEFKEREGRTIIRSDSSGEERYEFYRNIVQERFGVWRGDKEMVNIVGIRGMKSDRQARNIFKQHNDTIAVTYRDRGGEYFVKEFLGSTDPGQCSQRSPRGLAHIKDGSYIYYLGSHPGSRVVRQVIRDYADRHPEKSKYVLIHANNRYDALQPKIKVTLYRDKNFSGYITQSEMVEEDRGKYGINIHYSASSKPYSAGCQVISGMNNYFEFMNTIKCSNNKDNIPYTVVHASKVASM